jgi:HEAT repeat protein
MSTRLQPIGETTVAADLNELAQALVRELAMACRKVSVYGATHPMAHKAIEKPFFALNEIFRYKNHVNLNLQEGSLYTLNISPKKSVFTEEITRYMLTLDADAILFNRQVTATELLKFMDRFVRKAGLPGNENVLCTFLENSRIDTIEVNSEKAFRLFEAHKKYRGDIYGDYSVKNIALQQMGDDLELLAQINNRGQDALDELGIDFQIDVIRYLLPEKIAAIACDAVTEKLIHCAQQINLETEEGKKDSLFQSYQSLYTLIDYHPQRDEIVTMLARHFPGQRLSVAATGQPVTPVGAIRVESSEQVDLALHEILDARTENYDIGRFGSTFQRLLKTGQRGKAVDVVLQLMSSLASPEAGTRQKALDLILCSIRSLDVQTDALALERVIERMVEDLTHKRETYEYSEVLWRLAEKCLVTGRFDLMARLTNAMAMRRKVDKKVTVYDSMAVKKAFENITRREIVDALVDEMIRADHETSGFIREILISTGSEEVAVALSHIISHPVRQVRQRTLKVLAELGQASLEVFSRILMDDTMFERESGRHELPNSKWYIIRNSIFVLGSLRDPEGIPPLRLRITDNDVRIRREIVSALEKIGGEEVCDLLLLMADDSDREIRENAVIAVGLIGNPETAPMLVDLARRNPSVAVRAISALGKIGGAEAQSYLIKLLEDDSELNQLSAGQISKDELRIAAIKALGNIGDEISIATIRGYKEKLNPAQKIFFKNSSLNKTITEILARY